MNKNGNESVDVNQEMAPENKSTRFRMEDAEIEPTDGKSLSLAISNQNVSIDVLNDDSLREILSYFPLSNLIVLEEVSQRWRRVIESLYRKFRKIKIDARNFVLMRTGGLVRVGEYLCELELTDFLNNTDYNDVFYEVNKHCKNLTRLKVKLCAKNPKDLNGLSKHIAKKLKCFHVENDGKVYDGALSLILKKTVNLEEFVVKAWQGIKGSSLSKLPKTCKTLFVSFNVEGKFLLPALEKLPNLENLYICFCYIYIPSSYMSNRLVSLIIEEAGSFYGERSLQDEKLLFPNLKTFKVSKCPISLTTLQNLISQCPLIEDLALCDFNILEDKDFLLLQNFQHLKHLDVSGTKIGGETLLHLTIMSNKLQTIRCNGCESITQEELLQLINASPKLSCLKIGPVDKIERNFFEMALKSVNERPDCNFLTIEISGDSDRYCDFGYALFEAVRLKFELKYGQKIIELGNLNIKFCIRNMYFDGFLSKFIDN